jgi:multiple sugar transport system substrate-binding protein
MAAFSKAYLAGLLAVLTGAAVLAGCGTDSTSSGGGGGSQTIQIWEGYTAAEAKTFSHMVAEYEAQHPGQKVSPLFVNNDNTLQKVLTAVRGGSPPDIAYLYGSWAPNVAQIPQVVNLTQVVKRPGVNWDDFWTGERAVATVNGRVIGIPAVVDNLAVVYNKTLFAKAGLQPPGPDWTWQEFVADAKKLTNPAIKQFGTAYVTPGTEDTVWHWEALLWEAGGQLLTPDNKKAAFDSAAGLASLNTLRTMAVTDKSMYLDPSDSAYGNLFNSGKIGMLVTGPWDLSSFPNVKYGVQVMPAYPGTSGGTWC